MSLHHILHAWLRSAATKQVHDAVMAAARQEADTPVAPRTDAPKPCHLGLVFALGIESGCFEDLLDGVVTIRADGFILREGGLHGHRIALILSGAGGKNAARATELLIAGHQPGHVISAGFAGALRPDLRRNDLVLASRVLSETGELAVTLPDSTVGMPADVHCGAMLSVDRVARRPSDKSELADRYGALSVDMESYWAGELCRRHNVPFSTVRVISDTSDETLPPDVEHLVRQKSQAARAGAALGAIWRRPASVKDLYQLRENALIASRRLATFLAEWPLG